MHLLRIISNAPGEPRIFLEQHVENIPGYAILSHRWGPPADEVTFEDFKSGPSSVVSKKGYQKIKRCCEHALEYGLEYCWIDTCCIDKSSSAELSEAINSMYGWYRDAQVCFAYLNDVPSGQHSPEEDSAFRESVWFTRGWTLQELIAPVEILFFAQDWNHRPIGTRSSLARVISQITSVSCDILTDRNRLQSASIAQKMSWAAGRKTTRIEDEAYSLIGMFDVSMPIIYGEGKRAFLRLQEEIMLRTTDHTLFAWNSTLEEVETSGMLAPSPHAFSRSADYVPIEFNEFSGIFLPEQPSTLEEELRALTDGSLQPSYSMTNFGLNISLPTLSVFRRGEEYLFAYLACMSESEEKMPILFLRRRGGRPDGHFIRTCLNSHAITHHPLSESLHIMTMKTRSLWISGLGKQQGQARAPSNVVSLDKLIIQSQENDGMRWEELNMYPHHQWENLIVDRAYDYKRIVLEQGEHVVIPFLLDPPYQNPFWVTAAFGLQNGEPWYHFQGPFSLKYPGGVAELAKREYFKYDILIGGQFWQDASKIKYFTDDPLAAQGFGPDLISTWRPVTEPDGSETGLITLH